MRTFDHYSYDEARAVGAEFIRRFVAGAENGALDDEDDTAEWTEAIIDMFAETAPSTGVVVDAHRSKRLPGGPLSGDRPLSRVSPPSRRREASSECLVDLAHHRFREYSDPRYGRGSGHEYWLDAYRAEPAPEMLLALESESGRRSRAGGYSPVNVHAVLSDASKLVALACRVKVVVFATNGKAERDQRDERTNILEVADAMRAADYTSSRDPLSTPTWLWLDLPWASWKVHPPTGWIGSAGPSGLKLTPLANASERLPG